MGQHKIEPSVTCPVCLATSNPIVVFPGTHTLVSCDKCHLLFSLRILKPDFFEFYKENDGEFYNSPYFSFQPGDMKSNPDYPNYEKALQSVKSYLPKDSKCRLLDVGCGKG